MEIEKIAQDKMLHLNEVNKRLEREYENFQSFLHGETEELHSANEQQAKRYYKRIKPIREYSLSIRKGFLNAKHQNTKIADDWARTPVKSGKSGVEIAKPHSQIESDAEICESKLLKRNGDVYVHNYFAENAAMKGRLFGKIALVTGSASGIGREITRRFALEGAQVSVVDLNLEGAKKVVKEIEDLDGKAIAVQCDVGDENQVTRAIEETEKNLGSVDILVNNAGIDEPGLVVDLPLEKWRDTFRVHVEGTFLFCKAVLKNMKPGGRIINMSSISGVTGTMLNSSYSSAKAAINAFTQALAGEVGHKGITVNAIAPGITNVGMGALASKFYPELYKSIPVKRLGEAEDIAGLAAFLASPEAGYITGQIIVVDGGWSLTMAGVENMLQLLFGS
jgi:3-oxoacyl-[acyl-carrier protein] reductase